MAGGTWTTQNKVRPGVYINFVGEGKAAGAVGERGVVTLALPLSWGESRKIKAITAGDNVRELLGYDISAPELVLVKEALKRAKTLLLYRLNDGVKASAAAGALTVTARYSGVRGNDLSMVIQPNVDDNAKFDVRTLLAGQAVDSQTAADIAGLQPNGWVTFSGTGALTATAGTPLTGGTDGAVANQDHSDYLGAVEVQEFHTLALVSGDASLKSVYAAFIKRLRDSEGRKVKGVLENYPSADHEGIISVKNGVVLNDGTVLNAQKATVWVAAATAGAPMNQSLTYQAYDDAADVDTRYTNSQLEAALKNGEFVFVASSGRAIVEQDINTFKSFTPTKGRAFSKNRVMRVLDGIADDFKRIFESYYIGKVDNHADGRNLFRKECIAYLDTLQSIGAIQQFDAKTDIVVEQGTEADSVYVELNVQPVDSIEKIYMKVTVK
ncbi:Phage tail sheath protein [Paenibacillus sp. UNCCL117]|uniref:phage tail sheath family protein n=1 Tax=unclassified Paenibacillus TaxID=185978 RepID=UPI00087E8387|nr:MULTISPECIES: phage tail sheath family protein [unclassified Paenibacillus]SDD75400.1 Phage tail sheath protein [Paenibacillus sp. cl123]SFW52155.1 Phage tail sheath protein [Paenibacillus sp. UNCCL117]